MIGKKSGRNLRQNYFDDLYKHFRANLEYRYKLCTVELINDNLYHWKINIVGPKDTPYEDGNFILKVNFSDDYLFTKPIFFFVNKIYHLNISQVDGKISPSIFKNWNITSQMINVFSEIYDLFYNQDPNKSYDSIMAKEYETDREEFNRKAKEWTKKYASKKNLD